MNRAEWEEKQKKNKVASAAQPYKFGATTVDVIGNVLYGAIKGLEGIYDVGATAVGAVGGLFDKEFRQDVKEKVAFDWVGNNFDLGGAVEGSLINRMGEKGQGIVRGVAQGLGQMLPAVGMNALLPGSGLATIATSAAGGGTERAFQDNADYGKGMLYGAVVGTVEALTEKMTGGFTKGVFGKGFLDDAIEAAIKKTSKSALFKVAINFAEEGFEEMVATAVEPAIREIYQKGAAKETFTKEHAEDILYDGLIGGLTGIVYGGTVGQIGAKSRNVYESAQELKNIDEKKTRLWEKDKLDDTAETKLNAEKEATQLELKKRLAKLSDVKREQLTKRLNLDLDEQGNFRSYEAEDGYNKGAYSPTLHGKESALAYKPVKTELTDAQKSAVKLNSTLNKIMRVKTDVVVAEDLGTTPDGQKIGATFDKGVLYIDSSIDDKTLAKRKVIHEITHSLESLGKTAYTNFRSAMMKAVEENAEVKKLLDPAGNLWQDTIKRYQSQLEGKTAFEQNYIVTTEIMAQYAEVLFTDEKVIERLAQENRTLVQKIYNKIKNYIEYLKQRKENPELANFLRQAEKLYKKALESSAQRSTLTDAKAIGEIMEGKETQEAKPTAQDDSRKSIDSDGNALTPQQAEFFKDSKVRDEQGRLLKVYHGTRNGGFNIFEYNKDRQTGTDYGKAFYFTSDKIKAHSYSIDTSKNPKVIQYMKEHDELLAKFVKTKANKDKEAFLKHGDGGKKLSELLGDETIITEGSEVKNVFLNITKPYIANAEGKNYFEVYKKYFAEAKTNRNDGIIVKNVVDNPRGTPRPIDVYIAFNSNQIKLTTNLDPTESDDIRYSIDAEKAEEHRKKALEKYGTTTDFRAAGFLLPDGKMLNFDLGKLGNHGASRIEHQQIAEILDDIPQDIWRTGMYQFIYEGNIRIKMWAPGIQMSDTTEPTSSQYDQIYNIIEYAANHWKKHRMYFQFFVDYTDKIGMSLKTKEYTADNNGFIDPERIIDDIQTRFYINRKKSGIRYSLDTILAADDKTVYDEKKIKDAMTDAIAEQLQLGDYEYGELSKIGEQEMMKLFADEIKQSKNKEATAKKVAEFIVENAVVENAGDFTGVTMQDINTYNSLKNYLHKFNLNAIKDEIKYRFDKDKSVFARFGARKGQISFTADVIAQELESSGIFFKGINEADLFFEFVDMYKQYSDMIHKRVKDNRRLFMHNMNGFMVDKIIEDLAKDILRIIENEGRPAVPKDIAKAKNAEIKELDAKIKAMAEEIARMENEAGAETERSSSLRSELYDSQYQIDRLNLELKESTDQVRSLVEIASAARSNVRLYQDKLLNAQKRHRAEMALFERIDRVKNLTEYMGAGVQLADEVIGLIKLLKKQKTWRGKLTADIRNIMKSYSRKTDGVALYDLLSQDENLYADEIQAIANGQGELTTDEIITLKDVLDKFVHDVREYDQIKWQGEKAHATEVGANLIKETGKTIPFKKGWLADEWRKIDNALEAPYWRFMRLSNYDDNGIMAKMFWELKDALNKRDGFSMKVVKHFEEFYKKNQKLVDSWRDTVDINGVKISKGQAMALYLSSFREQMQNHLYNQTENIVTDKEIHVIRKGTIKLVDEKKALKSMREAFENATEQKITEEWVQGLLSQFNAEEREYMRLVHDFFNAISAEAKTETDFALNGIRGDLEKHYFPIRVASDQIFKKIGDKMFMDLFTVYKPSFTKKVVKNAKNMVVIENITDVVNRHARQMADYYGFAVVMKTFTRIWNAKTENGTARQAVQKVDPLFEKYVDKLFKDMQHNVPEREGFDKLVSKFMGWGATAALAANPKVWVNQMVALFAGHGIGIKYRSLMKGLKNALKQKGDYSTMFENSPFLFARFNDGFNVASGALLEKKGLFGKASKLTELTLQPIEYMDKLMIAGVWNAAMIESNNDVKKAAEITDRAVIITQQNFTPLFRPEILRTNSSLLRLSTMFMSEPLQMFSQLFGAIDRRRVAKALKKRAVTPEEHANADRLLAEANKNMKFAFTTITVDLVLLTLIAQAFLWIKGKDDEEKFAVGFGKELLANFIGMFPFLRDAYSVIEGYDVTNMAYTGLTNITNAGKEIFTSVSDAVQGKYQSGQEISAGIRKTIIGLSQTFGIPVRNIESYVKGIVEKVSPSAGETYESWFWKKSDAEYQKVLDEALEKGNDRLADTVIDLMLKKRLTVDNDTVTKELKRLYKTGQQVVPSIVQPTITHNGESIELSARDYKQFVAVYSQANKEAETLIQSQAYRVLNDTAKADAVKLIYDYFYNLAKSELVGESTARYIDLTGMPTYKLAIILAQTKNLTADKDEQGKSISGTKKYKVMRALVGLYLTQAQKTKIMEYLGYTI